MIASIPLRPTLRRARPSTRARTSARSMATSRPAARTSRAVRAPRAQAAVRATPRARAQAITWETRTFAATALAIAAGFLLAVLYLGQITGMSAHDYQTQRLLAQRDELRRQHALADVQLAKLESPARIEVQAARLGLIRLGHVPVMSAEELAARK